MHYRRMACRLTASAWLLVLPSWASAQESELLQLRASIQSNVPLRAGLAGCRARERSAQRVAGSALRMEASKALLVSVQDSITRLAQRHESVPLTWIDELCLVRMIDGSSALLRQPALTGQASEMTALIGGARLTEAGKALLLRSLRKTSDSLLPNLTETCRAVDRQLEMAKKTNMAGLSMEDVFFIAYVKTGCSTPLGLQLYSLQKEAISKVHPQYPEQILEARVERSLDVDAKRVAGPSQRSGARVADGSEARRAPSALDDALDKVNAAVSHDLALSVADTRREAENKAAKRSEISVVREQHTCTQKSIRTPVRDSVEVLRFPSGDHRVSSRARFPAKLHSEGIEGRVLVTFVVDERGIVEMSSIKEIKSDHELFSSAVRDFLREKQFVPAKCGKLAVKDTTEREFIFSLNR